MLNAETMEAGKIRHIRNLRHPDGQSVSIRDGYPGGAVIADFSIDQTLDHERIYIWLSFTRHSEADVLISNE
jgi:hypothetical protein